MDRKNTIILQNQLVNYELIRKNVKNINMRIRADGSITISASPRVPTSIIEAFLSSRADYILHHLSRFSAQKENSAPQIHEYINGEKFDLLGRTLNLKVIENSVESVNVVGDELILNVKNTSDTHRKEKLISNFYSEECKIIFERICTDLYKTFVEYNVPVPRIKIKPLKSRWGSCAPQKGIITLNKHLIKHPESCIEYVAMHEFCHFIHPNHSKQFYQFFASLMPDWKERKKLLESTIR